MEAATITLGWPVPFGLEFEAEIVGFREGQEKDWEYDYELEAGLGPDVKWTALVHEDRLFSSFYDAYNGDPPEREEWVGMNIRVCVKPKVPS